MVKMETVVMALFVFIFIVSLLSTSYMDMSASYGITNGTNSSDFSTYFNKTNELNVKMNETRTALSNIASKAPADITRIFDITILFFDIVDIVLSFPNIIIATMHGLIRMSGLDIPPAFITFMLGTITAYAVWRIIEFLRKKI